MEALSVSGAPALLRRRSGSVGAILQFRHVRPPRRDAFQPLRDLEIAPDFLRRIVVNLRTCGYDLVSLDEAHRRLSDNDRSRPFVALTFDGGYRDAAEFAHPILKAEGAPFALYVPSSFPDRHGRPWWLALEAVVARNDGVDAVIDGRMRRFDCAAADDKQLLFELLYAWVKRKPSEDERLAAVADLGARHGVDMAAIAVAIAMDWRALAALAADPLVTVGAQTVNHVRLAQASEAAARSELSMGVSVLEAAFGRRPRHLAYPFGGMDAAGPREFALARELGFVTAVTTRPGLLKGGGADDLMALPRLAVAGRFQRPRHLRVLLSGAGYGILRALPRLDAA